MKVHWKMPREIDRAEQIAALREKLDIPEPPTKKARKKVKRKPLKLSDQFQNDAYLECFSEGERPYPLRRNLKPDEVKYHIFVKCPREIKCSIWAERCHWPGYSCRNCPVSRLFGIRFEDLPSEMQS